jgi:hypothetical protein
MVVGTMTEAQALARQLGMADLKWSLRQAGEYAQRGAEFDEWLRSPQLELARAIAASAAREWVPCQLHRT